MEAALFAHPWVKDEQKHPKSESLRCVLQYHSQSYRTRGNSFPYRKAPVQHICALMLSVLAELILLLLEKREGFLRDYCISGTFLTWE